MDQDLKQDVVMAIVLKEATATAPVACAVATFDKTMKRITITEFADTPLLPTTESVLVQFDPSQICAHSASKALLGQLSLVNASGGAIEMVSSVSVDSDLIESDLKRLLVSTVGINRDFLQSDVCRKAFALLTTQYRLLGNARNHGTCSLTASSVEGIFMRLDRATFNALNLFAPGSATSSLSGPGSSNSSLFGLLNKCRTRMGVRRLGQWIRQPLVSAELIRERHAVVEALVNSARTRQTVQTQRFTRIPDLDAIASRLSQSSVSLEDLVKVFEGVVAVNCLVDDMKSLNAPVVQASVVGPIETAVRSMEGFMRLVESTLDLAAASNGEYRVDAKFDPALGELGGKRDAIKRKMEKLRAAVPVDNVRIVECPQGMAFRVSRKQMPAVQSKKFRQLQVNKAEYLFTSEELQELVEDLLAVESAYAKKSDVVVKKIVSVASSYAGVVAALADTIASVDVLTAFAVVASMCKLVRPTVVDSPQHRSEPLRSLKLKKCRHLLVEIRALEQLGADYIANDVCMSGSGENCQIITGPNMGGKSTYIRSAALAVLMSQIGSFVPCETGSELPVFESIMCRVGASDAQVRGVSTFMQEMIEAATIVNSADNRSLVLIDELGRGTSTQDGLGLAWAIARHLKDTAGSFVLFATHFHELAQLPGAKNRHVAASVTDKGLTLLYEVRDGATSNSFGPNVAALAGYPQEVVEDAIAREKRLAMGGASPMDLVRE